jgi:hypothetical protein
VSKLIKHVFRWFHAERQPLICHICTFTYVQLFEILTNISSWIIFFSKISNLSEWLYDVYYSVPFVFSPLWIPTIFNIQVIFILWLQLFLISAKIYLWFFFFFFKIGILVSCSARRHCVRLDSSSLEISL